MTPLWLSPVSVVTNLPDWHEVAPTLLCSSHWISTCKWRGILISTIEIYTWTGILWQTTFWRYQKRRWILKTTILWNKKFWRLTEEVRVGVAGTWRRRSGPGEPGHPDQVHQVIISLWQIDDFWRTFSLLFPLPFMWLLLERRSPVASNQVILSLCITGLALSGRYLPHYFIFRQTYQCTMYGWSLLGG